ncbi:MAG: glycerol kinase, partial [Acidimicrobiia bacterium]
VPESTALGAAFLAGLAEEVWSSVDDVARAWHADTTFAPRAGADIDLERRRAEWSRAIERARNWSTG